MKSRSIASVTTGRPRVFQCSDEPRPNAIAYLPSVIAFNVDPMAAVISGCRVWWLIAALAMPSEGARPATAPARAPISFTVNRSLIMQEPMPSSSASVASVKTLRASAGWWVTA